MVWKCVLGENLGNVLLDLPSGNKGLNTEASVPIPNSRLLGMRPIPKSGLFGVRPIPNSRVLGGH